MSNAMAMYCRAYVVLCCSGPVQINNNFHPQFNPFNRFYLFSDSKFNYACQFVINFTDGHKISVTSSATAPNICQQGNRNWQHGLLLLMMIMMMMIVLHFVVSVCGGPHHHHPRSNIRGGWHKQTVIAGPQ